MIVSFSFNDIRIYKHPLGRKKITRCTIYGKLLLRYSNSYIPAIKTRYESICPSYIDRTH